MANLSKLVGAPRAPLAPTVLLSRSQAYTARPYLLPALYHSIMPPIDADELLPSILSDVFLRLNSIRFASTTAPRRSAFAPGSSSSHQKRQSHPGAKAAASSREIICRPRGPAGSCIHMLPEAAPPLPRDPLLDDRDLRGDGLLRLHDHPRARKLDGFPLLLRARLCVEGRVKRFNPLEIAAFQAAAPRAGGAAAGQRLCYSPRIHALFETHSGHYHLLDPSEAASTAQDFTKEVSRVEARVAPPPAVGINASPTRRPSASSTQPASARTSVASSRASRRRAASACALESIHAVDVLFVHFCLFAVSARARACAAARLKARMCEGGGGISLSTPKLKIALSLDYTAPRMMLVGSRAPQQLDPIQLRAACSPRRRFHRERSDTAAGVHPRPWKAERRVVGPSQRPRASH